MKNMLPIICYKLQPLRIFKEYRKINWMGCPMENATFWKENDGHFYFIKYQPIVMWTLF